MANLEHIEKIKQGVEVWNRWKVQKQNLDVPLDLSEADLSKANLRAANLAGANLRGAILYRANLLETDLIAADLQGADMTEAYLGKASLFRANLSGANLSGAFAGHADFSEASVINANLMGAHLRGADLTATDLRGANLGGADLMQTTMVNTNLEGANLSGCSVYGVSVWNVKLQGAIQSSLVITPESESPIQTDNLEVAQFIYLLLNNEKIRDVIDTIGKKAVLILGRFAPERKAILDAIREALRFRGYLPILFDFQQPGTRDTQETIVTLAGMSRFIIADITDPKSIPQELAAIVPNLLSVPVQPLLQSGSEPWGMYDHIKRYPWVLPLFLYETQDALLTELETKVIVPAEAKAREQTGK